MIIGLLITVSACAATALLNEYSWRRTIGQYARSLKETIDGIARERIEIVASMTRTQSSDRVAGAKELDRLEVEMIKAIAAFDAVRTFLLDNDPINAEKLRKEHVALAIANEERSRR